MSRYGASIELDPPASGWTLLVWLVPLFGGVGAFAVVTTVLARRHLAVGPDPSGADEGRVDNDAELRIDADRLADRRAFLVRSLSDADAEYLAGDLSDRDYLALRRRDMQRLATLDALGSSASSGSEASRAVSSAVSSGNVGRVVTGRFGHSHRHNCDFCDACGTCSTCDIAKLGGRDSPPAHGHAMAGVVGGSWPARWLPSPWP